ncbi:NUDIX hydrolase [Jeotgalibacillus salarius]|uniref:NUDIX domain-containing protein n=1 Tax=Jeotgalibacillus salarius TaxID=546023 RepID=A0A4Y8L9Z8_9BACL|nr:NUDIX domain-containing protein [Jeotgalibacillus salarius]TFD99475.1 NUDIX domain-containing protein [Jeotgalibacillus salarius]
MYPRANALGVVVKGNYILLEEQKGKHSKGDGFFYRPIGGTIEFGEKSDQTLVREFQEEIDVEITVKSYISCIENIYKIDQHTGHEITQLYMVDLQSKDLYQKEKFTVTDGDKITCAKWIPLEDVYSGKKVLYPSGLSDILAQEI